MGINYVKESGMLKAVAHPVRLRVIHGLMHNKCSVSKIVNALKLPQSTVSQHLGILRNHGIIKPEKHGVTTCYHVVDGKIRKIIEILDK